MNVRCDEHILNVHVKIFYYYFNKKYNILSHFTLTIFAGCKILSCFVHCLKGVPGYRVKC